MSRLSHHLASRLSLAALVAFGFADIEFRAQREEPRLPPGFDRAGVRPTPVDVHGPFDLTSRDLNRLKKVESKQPERSLGAIDHDLERLEPCAGRDCIPPPRSDDGSDGQTPRFTSQWDTDIAGMNDLNIAVSPGYVVVAASRRIYFYEKSGQPLQDATGEDHYSALTFFKAALDDANTTLNLPPGLPPDSNAKQCFDVLVDDGFLLDTVFDVHVLFDSYRQRFWVAGLAINKDTDALSCTDPLGLIARRNKYVAAVSKTTDPRDGFYLYWWDAVIGDGTCNVDGGCGDTLTTIDPITLVAEQLPIMPSDKVDYPSIGISQKYFLATSTVYNSPPQGLDQDQKNPRYLPLFALPADLMTSGQCSTQCAGFVHAVGKKKIIAQPAVHHGVEPFGHSYFSYLLEVGGQWNVIVWALDNSPQPTLARNLYAMDPGDVPATPDFTVQKPWVGQGSDPDIPNPQRLRSAVTGQAMKASFRGTQLHLTTQNCTSWGGIDPCLGSIRVLGIDVVQNVIVRERTFGLRNKFDDAPTDRVSYLWPCLEVNKDDALVVGYVRAGETFHPEARFSAWMADDPDLLPSRLLRVGEYPVGQNVPPGEDEPVGRLDFTGMAVDPFDDTAVWMALAFADRAQPTSTSGRYRLTVGKVFGELHSDLLPAHFALVGHPMSLQQIQTDLTIHNQGDGAAPQTVGQLFLSTDPFLSSNDTWLKTFAVLPLPAGASASYTVSSAVVGGLPKGKYYVFVLLDVGNLAHEYIESNNLASISPYKVGFAQK